MSTKTQFINSEISEFSGSILADTEIDGGDVIALRVKDKSVKHCFTGVDIARKAGFAAFNLWVGTDAVCAESGAANDLNILGAPPLATIEKEFRADSGLYRTNRFFQVASSPLFPLANRLRGEPAPHKNSASHPSWLTAQVLGQNVRLPANESGGSGADVGHNSKAVHLHGLTYDKQPAHATITAERGQITAEAQFGAGFYGDAWTGEAGLTVRHVLSPDSYSFFMSAKNTGLTPVPMGMGCHPYIKAPSGDYRAVALFIPGRRVVEIDNYKNVWPTGRIVKTPPELSFNRTDEPAVGQTQGSDRRTQGSDEDARLQGSAVKVEGRYLDNLWVDLETDVEGFTFAELIDTKARQKIKLTALSRNIIGIQAYAPSKSPTVALEFVTHLADPREELWGATPTGMRLVAPGETFDYGFKIEVSKI